MGSGSCQDFGKVVSWNSCRRDEGRTRGVEDRDDATVVDDNSGVVTRISEKTASSASMHLRKHWGLRVFEPILTS